MAIRDRIRFTYSRSLIWRLSLWGLSLLCLLLVGIVWISGVYDTRNALNDGRRLLITLDTGAIEGKQISLDVPESPAPSPKAQTSLEKEPALPKEEKPAPPAAPAESAVSPPESTPTSPESPSPAPSQSPESAVAPESSPVSAVSPEPGAGTEEAVAPIIADMGAIKPAAVPLADIKDILMEKTSAGTLPIIGPKGLKSWSYYAKPYAHKGHLPTIAIIITGLGQNKAVSEAAIKLPENFSLSFSPYAKDLTTWANAARGAGHEIMVDLPLEPNNFPASDPGPYGLLVGKGTQENVARMQWLMSRIQGYVGFVCPQNEAFTANDTAFKDLLDLIASRGLMIGIEREPPKNETKKILDASKAPFVITDVIVDEELSAVAIQERLMSLEKTASKRGFAVGTAQAFPLTIQQLNLWSSHLEKDGFTLVPVTFIAKLKFTS